MKSNLLQKKSIMIGGNEFCVKTIELQSFLEIMRDEFDLHAIKDVVHELDILKDDILNHYDDNAISQPLKRRLKLVQEIQYLFQGVLIPT